MEFRVSLTEECLRCHGNGTRYGDEDGPLVVTCDNCYGMGEVPSHDGQEVLDFFHRFTVERDRRRSEIFTKRSDL